jgi:UDP-glucose-4-epimerase GalE
MTDSQAVLVAGGAGFIGSHVCKALKAAGYMPVTLDNFSTGHRQAVKWGPLVEGDLRDTALVQRTVADYGVVGALHFAAYSLVAESVVDPAKYYDNNIGAANAFASALIGAGVKPFVFSSTAAVYGLPQASLISEDHPTNPINPYGASKLAFEGALRWLGEAHGLRWTVLRYFNAAGADLDGEVGESHEPETHLIPRLCKAVYGKGPPVSVFGRDYDTPDPAADRGRAKWRVQRRHRLGLYRAADHRGRREGAAAVCAQPGRPTPPGGPAGAGGRFLAPESRLRLDAATFRHRDHHPHRRPVAARADLLRRLS